MHTELGATDLHRLFVLHHDLNRLKATSAVSSCSGKLQLERRRRHQSCRVYARKKGLLWPYTNLSVNWSSSYDPLTRTPKRRSGSTRCKPFCGWYSLPTRSL